MFYSFFDRFSLPVIIGFRLSTYDFEIDFYHLPAVILFACVPDAVKGSKYVESSRWRTYQFM